MLSIDLRNAFDPGSRADNFTCLLLRLIAKSDSVNRGKLRKSFPVAVEAVEIYSRDCPYKASDGPEGRVVDWDKIAELAEEAAGVTANGERLGATGNFPDGKMSPGDEGELKIAVGVRSGNVVVMFGKEVSWVGIDKHTAKGFAAAIDRAADSL